LCIIQPKNIFSVRRVIHYIMTYFMHNNISHIVLFLCRTNVRKVSPFPLSKRFRNYSRYLYQTSVGLTTYGCAMIVMMRVSTKSPASAIIFARDVWKIGFGRFWQCLRRQLSPVEISLFGPHSFSFGNYSGRDGITTTLPWAGVWHEEPLRRSGLGRSL